MKAYRVDFMVGTHKVSVKVWADNPAEAEAKATKENGITNYDLKSVKEL